MTSPMAKTWGARLEVFVDWNSPVVDVDPHRLEVKVVRRYTPTATSTRSQLIDLPFSTSTTRLLLFTRAPVTFTPSWSSPCFLKTVIALAATLHPYCENTVLILEDGHFEPSRDQTEPSSADDTRTDNDKVLRYPDPAP